MPQIGAHRNVWSSAKPKGLPGSMMTSSLTAYMARLRMEGRLIECVSSLTAFYSQVEDLMEDGRIAEKQYVRISTMRGFLNNLFCTLPGCAFIVLNSGGFGIQEIFWAVPLGRQAAAGLAPEYRLEKRLSWVKSMESFMDQSPCAPAGVLRNNFRTPTPTATTTATAAAAPASGSGAAAAPSSPPPPPQPARTIH